jgi:hypothetical protein
MKLRENFPKTKLEAEKFNVEFEHLNAVFKIFIPDDSSTLTSLEKTIIEINNFLVKNGYEAISPIEFIKNDLYYESEDEIVSISKHGYLEGFVLFIGNEENHIGDKYKNIDNDDIVLLKEFFSELNFKIKDKVDLQLIARANAIIKELPNVPSENVFVNFEYNNLLFSVSLSDYKIEFDCYLQNYYEDENGNKSDFEQIQQYCFKYELEGYTDIVGSFDQFRAELFQALKNAEVSNIYFGEEE